MAGARTARIARAALTVTAALCLHAGAATAASPRLHVDGSAIRDAQGRQVLLRGFGFNDLVEFGFNAPHQWAMLPAPGELAQLARIGVNSLRVAIDWSELEPTRGALAGAYLERIDTLLSEAADLGIGVVLDLHQDAYGPAWGLDGAPAWSCDVPPVSGPPSATTQVSPQVFECWTEFWHNTLGQQSAFIDMLHRLAGRLSGSPALVGYDVLNEPNPGLVGPPGAFESLYLRPFYTRAVDAIRSADPHSVVFVEPPIYRDFLVPTPPLLVPRPNVVYAPHLYNGVDWSYSPPSAFEGGVDEPRLEPDYALAAVQAKAEGTPWIIGEEGINFDGGANGPAYIDDEMNLADRYLVSHWWWDAGLANPGGFNVVDRTEAGPFISAWSRPYARATAGTLTLQQFDQSTHVFTIHYAPNAAVHGNTEIYLPAGQYPDGYTASATGASIVSDPNARVLVVRNARGRTAVHVTVHPKA